MKRYLHHISVIGPAGPRDSIIVESRMYIKPGYPGKLAQTVRIPLTSTMPGPNWNHDIYIDEQMKVETYGLSAHLILLGVPETKFICKVWRTHEPRPLTE